MQLDTPTLFTTITAAYFAGATVLGILALSLRSFPLYIRVSWTLWSITMLLMGSGAVLVGTRDMVPDVISIAVANALVLFGAGMAPNALSFLNRKGLAYPWLPLAATSGWLILYLFPWFRDDLSLRVFFIQSCVVLAVLLCIRQCWLRDRQKQVSTWFLIGVFVMDTLIRLGFIATHVKTHYPDFKASFQSPSLTVCLVALLIATVFKVVGLGIVAFEHMKEHYQEQALLDPLTGLPNRRAFSSSIRMELDRMKQSTSPYALVTLEIDNLQAINSRFGPSMGDAFLRLLGRFCSEAVDRQSVVGHIRDNQFALFLPGSGQTEACSVAKMIGRTLTVESTQASSRRLAVTINSGVFCGNTETSFERALEVSDRCLIRARKQGNNGIVASDGKTRKPLKPTSRTSPFAPRPQAAA